MTSSAGCVEPKCYWSSLNRAAEHLDLDMPKRNINAGRFEWTCHCHLWRKQEKNSVSWTVGQFCLCIAVLVFVFNILNLIGKSIQMWSSPWLSSCLTLRWTKMLFLGKKKKSLQVLVQMSERPDHSLILHFKMHVSSSARGHDDTRHRNFIIRDTWCSLQLSETNMHVWVISDKNFKQPRGYCALAPP